MEEIRVNNETGTDVATPYGFLCGILCASGIFC